MAGEQNQWWGDEIKTLELIWCAAHLHRIIAPPSETYVQQQKDTRPTDGESTAAENPDNANTSSSPTEDTQSRIPIAIDTTEYQNSPTSAEKTKSPLSKHNGGDRSEAVDIPDPFPLPKPAAISKSLLPLNRRVAGNRANELDIDATVEQTAQANGLLNVVFRPKLERWFEVHLLIDRSPPMEFWGDLAQGVATLFRWQGFFRDVRVWVFDTTGNQPRLFSGTQGIEREIASLIAPGRNRLFVVLTDTLGKAWNSGKAFAALFVLGKQHPVTIAHVFPQQLWKRTALHQAILRPLVAEKSGCPNLMLKVGAKLRTKAQLYQFPILNLSPNHFSTWANFIAGSGGNSIQGVLIRQEAPAVAGDENSKPKDDKAQVKETPEYLLREFQRDASPEARQLALVMAAVPLIPPVMRLAQRLAQDKFEHNSEHWHLAEFFFSGLLQRSLLGPQKVTVGETWYEFKPGIRDLLLGNSPVEHTHEIWRKIGDYIQRNYGSLRNFQAMLIPDESFTQDMASDPYISYFAEVKAAVFMTFGGKHAEWAREFRKRKNSLPQTLKPFEFETVTVNARGEVINTEQKQAYYFLESLTEELGIEMVSIPEGTFEMGSPEDEKGHHKSESPQHTVTVQSFFMGKYPVTQAQWRFVAQLPQIERELKTDPSRFKGENLPVERISWYDAKEFCERLSKFTGRVYRLPSEAEWEYACRAGTTTPFYFGETITGELANYDASVVFAEESEGEYREKTTEVGQFKPNSFGLYDMHGNVWEWCLDNWHDNYEEAPFDNSPWVKNLNANDNHSQVLRGGSWTDDPEGCRSACRINYYPDNHDNFNGFRLVCDVARRTQ